MNQEAKKIKLVKNSTSFDLIIPEEVEQKIRYLCSRIHDVEWSGTLFYTVDGCLDDGTFKITCSDICVMDIGSSGYTEFKDTSDIINYRLEHDLLRPGVYEGLIHSHNNMAAFFSGTDTNTLREEGNGMNHFLSLIVCNAGQYVARITRKLKKKVKAEIVTTYTEDIEYNTFEDITVNLSEGEEKVDKSIEEYEDTVIEYFELKINKTNVVNPFAELDERLESIKNLKIHSNTLFTYKQEYIPSLTIPQKNDNIYTFSKDNKNTVSNVENKPTFKDNISLKTDNALDMPEFYKYETTPTEIVRTLCTQLLTSSILASPKTNLNLNDWVRKMDKLYENRFGSLKDQHNIFRITTWIQYLIDSILGFSVNKEFEDQVASRWLTSDYDYNDSDAFLHLYAIDMIDFLETLPKSVVKDLMIEELINILPVDYDNNRKN